MHLAYGMLLLIFAKILEMYYLLWNVIDYGDMVSFMVII